LPTRGSAGTADIGAEANLTIPQYINAAAHGSWPAGLLFFILGWNRFKLVRSPLRHLESCGVVRPPSSAGRFHHPVLGRPSVFGRRWGFNKDRCRFAKRPGDMGWPAAIAGHTGTVTILYAQRLRLRGDAGDAIFFERANCLGSGANSRRIDLSPARPPKRRDLPV